MRKILIAVMLLSLGSLIVSAQTRTFARDGVEYVIELPSPTWRVVSRVDVHEHVEFVNGNDKLNGYLRLSKILVQPGTTAADLFQSDEKWNLQRLPGYVICGDCKGETLRGYLTGAAYSYEYVSGGRTMAGRVYYLQVDNRTFYALRFTMSQETLQSMREQMDSIARSFRLK